MKPFTLEWWILWKEYCYEMLIDVDMATDDCSLNPDEYTDEQIEFLWDEWERFRLLHEWIKKRIVNKYGEK